MRPATHAITWPVLIEAASSGGPLVSGSTEEAVFERRPVELVSTTGAGGRVHLVAVLADGRRLLVRPSEVAHVGARCRTPVGPPEPSRRRGRA